MIFDDEQINFLKNTARYLVMKLEESKGQKEDFLTGIAMGVLVEACNMGYEIACHNFRSTPWEYALCAVGETHLNDMSGQGWEPLEAGITSDGLIIMRRRKAVGDRLYDKK
ncbi:MAG: hypothetical protein J2P41_11815 [Blastocatellia bacterium]|nr:hypothetical protein [Blastocatellia bacterium]